MLLDGKIIFVAVRVSFFDADVDVLQLLLRSLSLAEVVPSSRFFIWLG